MKHPSLHEIKPSSLQVWLQNQTEQPVPCEVQVLPQYLVSPWRRPLNETFITHLEIEKKKHWLIIITKKTLNVHRNHVLKLAIIFFQIQ